MFPVSVTQQSPAAVSMETYHITLTLPPTQVEGVGNGVGQQVVQLPPPFQLGSFLRGLWGGGGVLGSGNNWRSRQVISVSLSLSQLEINLKEIPGEGLLVSWAFRNRPDLSLTVRPKLQAREVREQGWGARGGGGQEEAEQGGGGRAAPPPPPLSLFSSPCREVRSKWRSPRLRS